MTTLLMNSKNSESLNARNIDEDGNGKGSPEVNQQSCELEGSPEVNQQSCELEVTGIHPPEESNWGILPEKSAVPWGSSDSAPETWIPAEESSGGCDSESDKIPDKSDDGSDDDDFDDLIDQYDSDGSQKDHEKRKKNKLLRSFFETMDGLSSAQITAQTRRWHCPACHDGPGAIAWYKGLQPLMTHAKTKTTSRIRLHREFVEILDEELQRRGLDVKVFSKWKGIHESTTNPEIVWPPMVVLFNTLQKKTDTDEGVRISCTELCEYFKDYAVAKAHHCYGPTGHQGMSVLIFEASAMGYWEAENLHKHFLATGRDREAWEQNSCVGSQFYGFLAKKDDMDTFNELSEGRIRLKYEMQSYQEMVVTPLRQMSKDSLSLLWFKSEYLQQQERIMSLEETQKTEEDKLWRLQNEIQPDERNKEDCAKCKLLNGDSGTNDVPAQRKEETLWWSSVKKDEDAEMEKRRLIRAYDAKKAKLELKQLAQRHELEKEFASDFAKLLEKQTLL